MTGRFLHPLLALLMLGLSGCSSADGVAHLIKLALHSDDPPTTVTPANPTPGTTPVSSASTVPPQPAAAPRAAVTAEDLPPARR
jgi:hypothetical protein